jgi:hypothetical protein
MRRVMRNKLHVKAIEQADTIGEAVMGQKQFYTYLGSEPHTRCDSVETTLSVLRGRCRSCGLPYTQKVSAHAPRPYARCLACHKASRPVSDADLL